MDKEELRLLVKLELKKAIAMLELDDTEQLSSFDRRTAYKENLPTLVQTLKSIRKDTIALEKLESETKYD